MFSPLLCTTLALSTDSPPHKPRKRMETFNFLSLCKPEQSQYIFSGCRELQNNSPFHVQKLIGCAIQHPPTEFQRVLNMLPSTYTLTFNVMSSILCFTIYYLKEPHWKLFLRHLVYYFSNLAMVHVEHSCTSDWTFVMATMTTNFSFLSISLCRVPEKFKFSKFSAVWNYLKQPYYFFGPCGSFVLVSKNPVQPGVNPNLIT